MLGYFFKTARMPCEDDATYNRRRMRQISHLARSVHASRVLDWPEHLERPHNSASLAAKLLKKRGPDSDWLDTLGPYGAPMNG